MLDREEIARLTEEYGGQWGINHTRRLLRLIGIIAEGRQYNGEAVWIAAHLHDWGGYAAWKVDGVEHDVRSRQVAEEFLRSRSCPQELADLILECIEFHHGGDPNRSVESILLADADALDLLGVVGVLRTCCMVPRDLRGAYDAVARWRERETAAICLESTRKLAAKRVEEMDELMRVFEEETFGMF